MRPSILDGLAMLEKTETFDGGSPSLVIATYSKHPNQTISKIRGGILTVNDKFYMVR